jgi:hypothetical protein
MGRAQRPGPGQWTGGAIRQAGHLQGRIALHASEAAGVLDRQDDRAGGGGSPAASPRVCGLPPFCPHRSLGICPSRGAVKTCRWRLPRPRPRGHEQAHYCHTQQNGEDGHASIHGGLLLWFPRNRHVVCPRAPWPVPPLGCCGPPRPLESAESGLPSAGGQPSLAQTAVPLVAFGAPLPVVTEPRQRLAPPRTSPVHPGRRL